MSFNITISDGAVRRIKFLLQNKFQKVQNQPEKNYLRISVESGGCSGLQYNYEFVADVEKDDLVINYKDINLVIDEISQEYLQSSTLDYIEELGQEHFKIENPNAASKCGCGNSFGV